MGFDETRCEASESSKIPRTMPSSAATQKKVRCPKCTARFWEPAKPVFECPICAASLSGKEITIESGNGILMSAEGLASTHANNPDQNKLGQGESPREHHHGSIANGDDGAQYGATVSGRWEDALPSPRHPDIGQELIFSARNLSNLALESDDNGKHKSVPCSFEGSVIDMLMDVAETVRRPSHTSSGTEQTRCRPLLDHGEKVGLKEAEMEHSNGAEENEGIEEPLQSQILRKSRYDFSFRYVLENASSLEVGDRSLHGKRSEVDFPASLLESLQEIGSFAQDDPLHRHASQIFSSMPHQLELLDMEDSIDQEGIAIPEPSPPLHGPICEAFVESEDVVEVAKGLQVKQDKITISQDAGLSRKSLSSDRVQDEVEEFRHVHAGTFSEDCCTQPPVGSHSAKAFTVGRIQGYETGEDTHVHQLKVIKQKSNEPETHVVSPYDDKEPSGSSMGQLGQNSRGDTSPGTNRVDSLLSNANLIISHGSSLPSRHMDMEHNVHVMTPYDGEHEGHPQMNMAGLSVGSSQPHICNNFATDHSKLVPSHLYAYQVLRHPLIFPAGALQSHVYHAFSQPAYHHISPICMVCAHHQHPQLQPLQTPPFALCLNQSGSISYSSGHGENHGPASAYASSSRRFSRPLSCPTRPGQRNDVHTLDPRSKIGLARKGNHYPPFPEGRAAPYITCRGCSRMLQVPLDLPYNDGCVRKIRCGVCTKICIFSVHGGENKLESLARATNICQYGNT